MTRVVSLVVGRFITSPPKGIHSLFYSSDGRVSRCGAEQMIICHYCCDEKKSYYQKNSKIGLSQDEFGPVRR